MKKLDKIILTVNTSFRPGAGENSLSKKEFSISEISKCEVIDYEYFKIKIVSASEFEISGQISWQYENLVLDLGSFIINSENNCFRTEPLNIAYDTHVFLTLETKI